ncbi:MAG TPA: NADH-quinone oxidoreductase subunit J [Planctomycetota bacterium]|jgi:NADH-quinone oxidoreductase subunit J
MYADTVFLISAIVCFLSALAIVLQKNPVYSVLFMLPFFLGMTTLFILLQAPFLAAIQMIVYGGAILVLFLFVIMLINLKPEDLKDDWPLWSTALATVGVGMLGGAIREFVRRGVPEMVVRGASDAGAEPHDLSSAFAAPLNDATFGSVERIGQALFSNWVVPFELASILILVAMLGAVLISKKKV